jgi:hypothetical protein
LKHTLLVGSLLSALLSVGVPRAVLAEGKGAPEARPAVLSDTKPDADSKPNPVAAAAAKEAAKPDAKPAEGDAKDAKDPKDAKDAKEDEKSDGPITVKVGLYILSIGKFEVATGTYTVDFYLDLTSDKPMGEQKLEFMNGRASSTDKIIDKPMERFYRIQANLMTNVDMHRYPWDRHELPIILENSSRPKSEVVYVIDDKQQGVDPDVKFVGWNLEGFQSEVHDHNYKVYNETYSQYVGKIVIGRIFFIASLKTFLPVFCFVLICFVSLLVTLEKLDSRVSMNTAMLIASVMFHLSIGSQLPPAGYLTVADKVMIATYVTIGFNLLLSVMMMRQLQLKQDDKAKRMREGSFKWVPGLAMLSYIIASVL